MSVLIVDYGMGNIASARRSLEECGGKVIVSGDPARIADADRIVIPGVGAFPMAMERLTSSGWATAIRDAALIEKMPVLGICLGMQLLADVGLEFVQTPGLGLIPGRVERIMPVAPSERVPHVGWNEVNPNGEQPFFASIPYGADFYFVHSYRFIASDKVTILATTPYCGETVAVVGSANVIGTQFHPEKSSRVGLQLLRNFLNMGNGPKC